MGRSPVHYKVDSRNQLSMGVPRRSLFYSILLLAFLSAGWNKEPPKAPSVGKAFIAPITLNLRQENAPGSKAGGAPKHGEPVGIFPLQRRFLLVLAQSRAGSW